MMGFLKSQTIRYLMEENRMLRNALRESIELSGKLASTISARKTGGPPPSHHKAEVKRTAAPKVSVLFKEIPESDREKVRDALTEAKGNMNKAAELLGISVTMVRFRMKKFGFKTNRRDFPHYGIVETTPTIPIKGSK